MLEKTTTAMLQGLTDPDNDVVWREFDARFRPVIERFVRRMGLSEADARKSFAQVDIYKTSFRPMKISLTNDASRMLMKLVVDGETDRVVGVHIVGPDAPEMIQMVGIAVKAGLTKAQFDRTCAVHPTSAEELGTLKNEETRPDLHDAG